MTEDTRPAPIVPPEVDLRGYEYMPLYSDRLLRSSTWISAGPEGKVAMIYIWWHAFGKETPAASLPNNDRLLADYAGFGVAVSAWRAVREEVLRGFVECSDGRLYHRFLAAIAVRAWRARIADALRGAKARLGATRKREEEARGKPDHAHISELLQVQSQELGQLQSDAVTADLLCQKLPLSQGQRGKERKGEERKGEEGVLQDQKQVRAQSDSPTRELNGRARADKSSGEPITQWCAVLSRQGVKGVAPDHPVVVDWYRAGRTQLVEAAIAIARERKPKPEKIPIPYLEPIVAQLARGANGSTGNMEWWSTPAGIEAKATELGVNRLPKRMLKGERLMYLRCAIAVKEGGDVWAWIDPRNETERRIMEEIREATRGY